jgi:hypothetical protein
MQAPRQSNPILNEASRRENQARALAFVSRVLPRGRCVGEAQGRGDGEQGGGQGHREG